ncbi:aminotransferase class I/II-fold pyridoxal phosphate-dependent enzyme [Rufibacter ruber]|uniref:aminotransferase class I/II-fold pyridoxal phosphate-dependent enzyme n=1 Tax=Rufibacter ruber TaxID=1783499 RepID=UPI000AA67D64|nr:aminotransferase class I/II-fold pyridoxal phosphate-dependent enzyme [Rufibacter ruber]
MEVLSLHLGVSHFATPPAATQALQAALSQPNQYGPTEGIAALREAIAQRYQEDEGISVTAEQILITHGTKHALHLYLSCLLTPGAEVIAPAPYWFAFPEIVRQAGGQLVSLPANPAKHYALDVQALRERITPQTRLLLLTNPGNPTGKVYSPEELHAVAQLLEEYPQLHVLSDEIYDGLVFPPAKMRSLLQFEPLRNRIAVVNGFSKSFAMANWRVGYLIAPAPLLQQATHLQHQLIGGVSPLNQLGAAAAMHNRHALWQSYRQDLLPKRQKVLEAIGQLPNLQANVPDAGYYVTLEIENCLQAANPRSPFQLVEEWAAALKDQQGLEVLPATNMGMPSTVRMSYALPAPELDEALSRLRAFVS